MSEGLKQKITRRYKSWNTQRQWVNFGREVKEADKRQMILEAQAEYWSGRN